MICGKTIYTNQGDAIKAIEGLHADKRPTKVNRKPQQTYWCDPCNGWHIHSERKKHSPKKSFSKNLNTQGGNGFLHKYNHNKLVIKNFSSKPIK